MSRFAWSIVGVLVALGLILALVEAGSYRACLVAGLGGCYVALLAAGSLIPGLDFYLRAARRGSPDRPWVALTFDDGPDPAITPLLLDLLQRERIPAAFFFVGEAAQRYPVLVARAAAEGHLIGNHSDRHGYSWTISSAERILAEFAAANQILASILGQAPRFARSPAGVSCPNLADVLQRLQLRNVAWDVRGLEGLYRDPERIAARVTRRARNGSIILLHELYYGVRHLEPQRVLMTTQLTIDRLRARGFRFARLDRLLEESDDAVVADQNRSLPERGLLLSDQRVPEPGLFLTEDGANEAMGYRRAVGAAPRASRAA